MSGGTNELRVVVRSEGGFVQVVLSLTSRLTRSHRMVSSEKTHFTLPEPSARPQIVFIPYNNTTHYIHACVSFLVPLYHKFHCLKQHTFIVL